MPKTSKIGRIFKYAKGPCGFCGVELQWYFDSEQKTYSCVETDTGEDHWDFCKEARDYHEKITGKVA